MGAPGHGQVRHRSDGAVRSPVAGNRPFRVPVTALRKHIGSTRRLVVEGTVDGLSALGVAVPDGSVLGADVELCSDPGGVTVRGSVTADWVGECRRCGGPVAGRLTADVRERFVPTDAPDGDEDAYPMEDDEIDLEPLVRDAALLELPLAPLCSDTCLGLCPQCGTNWNEGPCSCRPAADPRLPGRRPSVLH